MADQLPSTFHLERFFEKYEFTTRYLLSCSDAEAFAMSDLIAMADSESKVNALFVKCKSNDTRLLRVRSLSRGKEISMSKYDGARGHYFSNPKTQSY